MKKTSKTSVHEMGTTPAHSRDSSLPHTLVLGGSGRLGSAALKLLVTRAQSVQVMVTQRFVATPAGLVDRLVCSGPPHQWPLEPRLAGLAIVMFDAPHLHFGREAALWVPQPSELPQLARWLHACGVHSLAVVMPHAQASLPVGLQSGLANIDELALAGVGFERLLIVRSAQKPAPTQRGHALQALAAWMLGWAHVMVSASQQPVRASAVASFAVHTLATLLQQGRTGSFIASPERVWLAASATSDAALAQQVQEWLG